jgi:hypothetical protein
MRRSGIFQDRIGGKKLIMGDSTVILLIEQESLLLLGVWTAFMDMCMNTGYVCTEWLLTRNVNECGETVSNLGMSLWLTWLSKSIQAMTAEGK